MQMPSYLQRRQHGIYYFRRYVPAPLRAVVGRREILKSLRTREPREALRLARSAAVRVDSWFQDLHSALNMGDGEESITTYWVTEIELGEDGSPRRVRKEVTAEDVKALQDAQFTPEQIEKVLTAPIGVTSVTHAPSPDQAPPSPATASTTPSATGSATPAPTLATVISDFKQDWVERHLDRSGKQRELPPGDETKLRRLEEILGSLSVEDFDYAAASTVRRTLQKLPANTAQYRGMTAPQMAELGVDQHLTAKSVNDHIDLYHRVFDWAIERGLYPHARNPFKGQRIQDTKRAHEKRDGFSREDIGRIFGGDVFTAYGSSRYHKPHCYWGPLIALFTGARLAEIAGLRVEDIQPVEGQPGLHVFDINENTVDKRVKTSNAVRRVPIHSKLIDLGLLEYADSVREAHERLFPDLTYNAKEGYGRNLGDWFNRTYLPRVGIQATRRKTFHSFRHTFATALENADVPVRIIEQLSGRDSGVRKTTGETTYIKPAELARLAEAVEKLDFNAVMQGVRGFPLRA